MLRIEFQMELEGVLSDLDRTIEQAEVIEFDNALPVDESQWLMFTTVTCSADMNIDALLDSIAGIQLMYAQQLDFQPPSYHILVYIERTSSVLTVITKNKGIPHRLVAEDQQLWGIVSVHDWNHLKELAEAIETAYGSFELLRTTEINTIGYPLSVDKMKYILRGKLTEEQIDILEKAYRMGYFQVPQEVTGEEISEELDISRSTLSERIRRAENDLCEILFGSNTK